jgi:hypothetical protein
MHCVDIAYNNCFLAKKGPAIALSKMVLARCPSYDMSYRMEVIVRNNLEVADTIYECSSDVFCLQLCFS